MSGTADPRFFGRRGPFSVDHLADSVGARLVGPADGRQTARLHGVAPLQRASATEISFLDNRRYLPALSETGAGAVIVASAFVASVPAGTAALVTAEPYLAWARIAALFHPSAAPVPGIHRTACIEAGAAIDPSAQIGPFVVIGAGARIGAGCVVAAHAVIGDGVAIGEGCRIGSHASISHAVIGDRVTLYPGVRIGQDGFGLRGVRAGLRQRAATRPRGDRG